MSMTLAEDNLDTTPWYTQFWPWFLFGLPATVVVACVVTITLAVRSPLSLVNDDYYKEGLGINEDIAAREYASQLKIEALVNFANNRIQIDLNNEQTGQLEMALIHPTDARQDFSLQMDKIGNHRYEYLFETPMNKWPGQYRLRLTGTQTDALSADSSDAGVTRLGNPDWVLNAQLPATFFNNTSESAFNISSAPEILTDVKGR